MPTAKAKYKGVGDGAVQRDFSDALKKKLRGYYPDQQAEAVPPFETPVDDFVSRILMDARWGISELQEHVSESTKSEIRAEIADLHKVLNAAHFKLRNLSPDVDRLLGVDADPLGCADKIRLLLANVEGAGPAIDSLPTAMRSVEKQHAVMMEMTIRVLRTLKEFGIAPAQTADADFGYASEAVEILKAIGDDIGLVRSTLVWRDTIGKAKGVAPDLQ